MISSAAEGNRSRHCSFTQNRVVFARRSEWTNPVSASTFMWWETVDWPTSTWSTNSPTVIGLSAVARQLRSSTREGSPRHRNHDAQTSADRRSISIDYRR